MMMRFDDKVVLVTGASRGIGRSIAQLFAQQGARIAIHYNSNETAARETLDSLEGDGHITVQADMKNAEAVKQMVETAVSQMGGLHVLINNAGIYESHPIDEINYDEWQHHWQQVLNTNLIGPANAMYCATQHMKENGGGRIVNISSRGAFRGEPEAPAYGASKAGMNSMSQSLAKRLAPHNIFVGVVAPGFVETDMAKGILATPHGEFLRNESPFGRVAQPHEVAYAALFLASEGSEFMTGAIIDVNGASYLRT